MIHGCPTPGTSVQPSRKIKVQEEPFIENNQALRIVSGGTKLKRIIITADTFGGRNPMKTAQGFTGQTILPAHNRRIGSLENLLFSAPHVTNKRTMYPRPKLIHSLIHSLLEGHEYKPRLQDKRIRTRQPHQYLTPARPLLCAEPAELTMGYSNNWARRLPITLEMTRDSPLSIRVLTLKVVARNVLRSTLMTTDTG